MYTDHAKVSEIRYAHPVLSKLNPQTFKVERMFTPVIDPDNVAYHTLFKPFNLAYYLSPRLPIDMGLVNIQTWAGVPNVLRMPLKFPGTEYRVPTNLKDLTPFLRRVAEYEAWINPDHDACFCHVTFDRSDIEPGHYHRFPGFHGDGIQGTKLTPKVNIEHSYIMTSEPPTEFCVQPFFLKHLDEAKHNYFLEFDRQAREDNVYGTLNDHLYLIDPYMVHRTPKIAEPINRLFVRVTYAFTELQHPKNTINPCFEGQDYEKRVDIRENLCPFEFPIPYNLYGRSRK